MAVTAGMVKELREDGRRYDGLQHALSETGGDLEKAIDCAKRACPTPPNVRGHGLRRGYRIIYPSRWEDRRAGGSRESDFVARTEEFQTLVKDLSVMPLASNPLVRKCQRT